MNESKEELKADFIPEIEVDPKNLPSRGLSYPANAKISYRTYMHGEVRKVSTSSLGIENSLNIAMSGIKASFGTDRLTLQDAVYIAIMRKVSTLNSMEFEVPYVCSKCKTTVSARFKHTDINFNDIDKRVESLPMFIELSGEEFQISPMTVKGYLDLKSGLYDGIIKGEGIDKVAVQAISVTNMDFKKAYDHLYALRDAEDIEVLEEIDKLVYHDLKPLETICRNPVNEKVCGTKNFIKLEGREALISPFRKPSKLVGTRIRFSSTPKSERTTD